MTYSDIALTKLRGIKYLLIKVSGVNDIPSSSAQFLSICTYISQRTRDDCASNDFLSGDTFALSRLMKPLEIGGYYIEVGM